jgi:methyltransferase family protein
MGDDDGYFGEDVAEHYDDDPSYEPAAIELLAELAGGGRALEFAIGTGRIAVPLVARGVPVDGIELSAAMVSRLRPKPGAEAIGVTVGDMSTTRVPGTYRLVYLVFNTIMNLTSQEAQVACFRNAAAHLEPGGCFLVETMVPELQRLPFGERFRPFDVTAGHLGFDEYDIAGQGLVSHHVTFRDGAAVRNSVPFRYVWPAELDLMAQLAGMRPRDRWGGWEREPFTSESTKHVSVWTSPL